MNLPIQGSPDPRDDTHNKEDITEIGALLLDQSECVHDYQEIGSDLLECRHCQHRSRFGEIKSDRIEIKLPSLPGAFQTLFVPRTMLDEYIVRHFDRYEKLKQEELI
jgi:hypothetical protein